MQTIETLKRSIDSAQDLASVVRTMKAMAAVSIRQYETAAEALSHYSRTIETGLSMLQRQPRNAQTSNSEIQRGSERVGAIVFGSDQGMCGQFNQQITHFTTDTFQASLAQGHTIAPAICVGHRGADTLRSLGLEVGKVFSLPGSAAGITWLVQDLLPEIDEWRIRHRVSNIWLFYNQRISASTYRPHALKLLPLQTTNEQPDADASTASERDSELGAEKRDRNSSSEQSEQSADSSAVTTRCLPLWTMPTHVLFSRLLKQFLFVSVFRACAESLAGENASRIAAMQAAERNIKDRLHELRADYARRRQTAITEELMDVVTGFEALEHES